MISFLDFRRIKSKYYDPADRTSVQMWRMYKDPRLQECTTMGIVAENHDPDGLGRIKVRAPLVFADAVTPWIPVVRPWAGKKHGVWTVPDIGDAVIIGFIMRDPSKPFVMGCTPTKRTLPYLKENPGNDQKYVRTKSGLEIIMNDKDGEEQLIVSAKDGDMLILMDSKGIRITNNLGDISIKAKKVSFESGDMLIKTEKDTTVTSDGTIDLKGSSSFSQKADSGAVISGKKIKLKGKSGVCAGGMQIAKKDDMVVGVDNHDVQIPTNSGMRTIPMIPHPYVGKLADKLSSDVTVNDKPAAVKGSKSKNNPKHIPIGGVKFKKNPSNEGEVSSGTCATVKINGKEAAVLGAMVKTCSDPRPQETCSIIAVGTSVAIPIMPPGFDPEQYKRDGGFLLNTRDPVYTPGSPNSMTDERSLSDAKWSTDSADAGDEVTLSVNVQSQQGLRGAVKFRIYKDGADPAVDAPVAVKGVRVERGPAEVKWKYVHVDDPDNRLTEKPKFFFRAWAFKCDIVESSAIEMGQNVKMILTAGSGVPLKDVDYILTGPDGEEKEGTTGEDGLIEESGSVPGIHKIIIKNKDK